jgi:2-polyprenyl-3-methyl-5-hydroxy-6-metoxy-1,4-benzoquinol methylase
MQGKDAGYYAHLNVALLDAIPQDAAVVLEVGCGTGVLGAAHKARNPEAAVYGVEIHAAAAAEAARALDLVLCCGVEAADLGFLEGRADCIVYGDVLEHLLDPWSVLAAHRALLSPSGRIVASIPNVQHWSLIEHLLRGHWTYSDHGLLDDTHLRFFTYHSIATLFDHAGLRIERTLGLLTAPDRAAAMAGQLAPMLAALDVDRAQFEQTISPLQYLVVATSR